MQYEYDNNGNVTKATDVHNNAIFLEYDPLDRPIKVVDDEGVARCYEYDSMGNVTRILDENGNSTRFTYSLVGQLTAIANDEDKVMHPDYKVYPNLRPETPLDFVYKMRRERLSAAHITTPQTYVTGNSLDAVDLLGSSLFWLSPEEDMGGPTGWASGVNQPRKQPHPHELLHVGEPPQVQQVSPIIPNWDDFKFCSGFEVTQVNQVDTNAWANDLINEYLSTGTISSNARFVPEGFDIWESAEITLASGPGLGGTFGSTIGRVSGQVRFANSVRVINPSIDDRRYFELGAADISVSLFGLFKIGGGGNITFPRDSQGLADINEGVREFFLGIQIGESWYGFSNKEGNTDFKLSFGGGVYLAVIGGRAEIELNMSDIHRRLENHGNCED